VSDRRRASARISCRRGRGDNLVVSLSLGKAPRICWLARSHAPLFKGHQDRRRRYHRHCSTHTHTHAPGGRKAAPRPRWAAPARRGHHHLTTSETDSIFVTRLSRRAAARPDASSSSSSSPSSSSSSSPAPILIVDLIMRAIIREFLIVRAGTICFHRPLRPMLELKLCRCRRRSSFELRV
jgi:hypothetical protein